jgi:hypothetical protein
MVGAETGPSAMPTPDLDRAVRFAILREIGERLRALLREEPKLPKSFKTKIDRLQELEDR